MGELLSQDDLNALLGGSSEEQGKPPKREQTIVGAEIGGLLSQDDLNDLLATGSSGLQQTPQKQETTILGVDIGSLLSQDDLNALLGGAPESKVATQGEMILNPETPVTQSKGESMSQDEIDDLLRQFDRDI
jgi:flagellar motor switch protein FliM